MTEVMQTNEDARKKFVEALLADLQFDDPLTTGAQLIGFGVSLLRERAGSDPQAITMAMALLQKQLKARQATGGRA